jgi:hypothetical protein
MLTTVIVGVAFARLGRLSLRACITPTRADLAYALRGLRGVFR